MMGTSIIVLRIRDHYYRTITFFGPRFHKVHNLAGFFGFCAFTRRYTRNLG